MSIVLADTPPMIRALESFPHPQRVPMPHGDHGNSFDKGKSQAADDVSAMIDWLLIAHPLMTPCTSHAQGRVSCC